MDFASDRPAKKYDTQRTSPVTPNSTRNDELPIYESLVRERGDVVAQARVVAEETQHQATQALNGHDGGRQENRPQ